MFIPENRAQADDWLRQATRSIPDLLTLEQFLRGWSAVAYMNPQLHPDHFLDCDGGWEGPPADLARDAWRRFNAGEISEDDLYPGDAQWSGLYDQMLSHTEAEREHREDLRTSSRLSKRG